MCGSVPQIPEAATRTNSVSGRSSGLAACTSSSLPTSGICRASIFLVLLEIGVASGVWHNVHVFVVVQIHAAAAGHVVEKPKLRLIQHQRIEERMRSRRKFAA